MLSLLSEAPRTKDGLLILVQVDHISAEDLAWVIEATCMPGVRNRNLISTITKKGRAGHLLLLDIDPAAEGEIARFIAETIGSYGYHRIPTSHVHWATQIEQMEITISKEEKSISSTIRLKKRTSDQTDCTSIESDDLYALVKRIREELGCSVSPMQLRRKIEVAAASGKPSGPLNLCLETGKEIACARSA